MRSTNNKSQRLSTRRFYGVKITVGYRAILITVCFHSIHHSFCTILITVCLHSIDRGFRTVLITVCSHSILRGFRTVLITVCLQSINVSFRTILITVCLHNINRDARLGSENITRTRNVERNNCLQIFSFN